MNPLKAMSARQKIVLVILGVFALLFFVVVVSMFGGDERSQLSEVQGGASVGAGAGQVVEGEETDAYNDLNVDYQIRQQEESRETGEQVVAPISLDLSVETTTSPIAQGPSVDQMAQPDLEAQRQRADARAQAVQQKRAFFEALLQKKSNSSAAIQSVPSQFLAEDGGSQGGAVTGGANVVATGMGPSSQQPVSRSQITPGEIEFAVIQTSVTSDSPSPVRAEILSGPLKGAVLVGNFTAGRDGLVVAFNSMSWKGNFASVSAVAIDAETARTAMATDVDYHRIQRWGSLMLAGAARGAKAVVELESDVTVPAGSDTVIKSRDQLSDGEIAMMIFGEAGDVAIEMLKRNFDRPPTITIDQGTTVGMMFMAPVDAPWLPARR
ncbi:DotG/IcmE/VirB10 family protein [Alcanivorax sp. 1008]|uniref:DotG/IcmE/VirB10 family protein n=1 Tax=Alcanivorax sp. 1008 TaxID=2816853 RepID=UPI001DBB41F0|nr:DotG/IcmE/VirB10 family protein [Alcanivorax sp. 1008]MCC1496705.1 DotG/IcmE/VirB10 family protein [Alcanivorax sp. 1008]